MSRLRIFTEDNPQEPLLSTESTFDIEAELRQIGVRFEQWQASKPVAAGDAPDVVLDAYKSDIDRIVAEKGFKTVDVVSIAPDNPQREAMRAKFLSDGRV